MTTINSLAVRVVTSHKFRAGTDNDVYFDIGPLGWKLESSKNDFESGSDRTYPLDLHGLRLLTEDIIWLRLQKKGLGGWAGMPDFPNGGWFPHSIHLIVNEREFASFIIDEWITTGHESWMRVLEPYQNASPEQLFVRTLRLIPNESISKFSESIAFLTTNFAKNIGISGWLGTGLPHTWAIGTVLREPARSTDGLATIDLALEGVEVGDQRFVLPHHNRPSRDYLRGQRYLRVEYKFRASFPIASGEEDVPKNGDRVRIGGAVKWDTDHEGWYEIHPGGAFEVQILPPATIIRDLKSAYREELGEPEDVFYDWPGCDYKNAPPGLGPRRFRGKKWHVHQFYEIEAVVDNWLPQTVLNWSLNGVALQAGSGAAQIDSNLVSYVVQGRSVKLWNRPDDGSYVLQLGATIVDNFNPSSQNVPIYFEGIRIDWEPDYYKTIGACKLAWDSVYQQIRTEPQPVPKYDPAQLVQLNREELVSIIQEITNATSIPSGVLLAANYNSNSLLVETISYLSVQYPKEVGAVLQTRGILLTERIAAIPADIQ